MRSAVKITVISELWGFVVLYWTGLLFNTFEYIWTFHSNSKPYEQLKLKNWVDKVTIVRKWKYWWIIKFACKKTFMFRLVQHTTVQSRLNVYETVISQWFIHLKFCVNISTYINQQFTVFISDIAMLKISHDVLWTL